MAARIRPGDRAFSDAAEIQATSTDEKVFRGERSLWERQLSSKMQTLNQHDSRTSLNIPDVYILVVVSIFFQAHPYNVFASYQLFFLSSSKYYFHFFTL